MILCSQGREYILPASDGCPPTTIPLLEGWIWAVPRLHVGDEAPPPTHTERKGEKQNATDTQA